MLQIGFQIDDQSLETLFLIKQRLTQSFLNTGIKIIAFRTVNIPETELGFSNINQFFIKPQKPNMNFQHGSIWKQAEISQDTENNRFFPQSDISFQKLNSSSNVANQASIYQRFSEMPKITDDQKTIGFRTKLPSQSESPTDQPSTAARGITSRNWNPSSATTVANR